MLRTAARVIAYASGAVLLVVAILFGAFLYVAAPTEDKVDEAVSPNGKLTAILVETNGGGTTSFGYFVQLAPSENLNKVQTVASLYGAQRSEQAFGANLRWRSDGELAVEFMSATSADLLNASASVGGVTVRTALHSGIKDETAPAGGMLYNLKRPPDKQ